MRAFLGGSPGGVAVRLIVMSLLVGFLMSIFGISPRDIVASAERLFRDIFENGFEVFDNLFGYVLAGAIIVIPIWLVARILASGRR